MKTKENKRTNNVTSNANTSSVEASQPQSTNKHKSLVGLIHGLRFNENGEPEVLLALRVNEETIDVNGQRSEVVYVKIGSRRYPCVLEWVPAEGCGGYLRMEQAEVKGADRGLRCLLPDGKGGFIRCPDGKKCSECELAGKFGFGAGHTVSLDGLGENVSGASCMSDFTVVETQELLEQLIEKLNRKAPKYGKIFLAIYNGIERPSHIARWLNLPQSTTSEDVKKIRKRAPEIYKELTTV